MSIYRHLSKISISMENLENIAIDIDKDNFRNIDIDIIIEKDYLVNIYTDKDILEDIDIDKTDHKGCPSPAYSQLFVKSFKGSN